MVFAWSQSQKFLELYTSKFVKDMPFDILDKNYADIVNPTKKEDSQKIELHDQISQDIQKYRDNNLKEARLLYYALKLYVHQHGFSNLTDLISEYHEHKIM